ncbi:uncharacterized protein LOC111252655 [Varroa destructor]|uniref:Uncharacterized protein n=1 Tax=Varroa destructor TaxID=109461 RepID=A0A7M7KJ86_VARDE|nr:uncharacterized protein LOC111252655 [Varroa destructor]
MGGFTSGRLDDDGYIPMPSTRPGFAALWQLQQEQIPGSSVHIQFIGETRTPTPQAYVPDPAERPAKAVDGVSDFPFIELGQPSREPSWVDVTGGQLRRDSKSYTWPFTFSRTQKTFRVLLFPSDGEPHIEAVFTHHLASKNSYIFSLSVMDKPNLLHMPANLYVELQRITHHSLVQAILLHRYEPTSV